MGNTDNKIVNEEQKFVETYNGMSKNMFQKIDNTIAEEHKNEIHNKLTNMVGNKKSNQLSNLIKSWKTNTDEINQELVDTQNRMFSGVYNLIEEEDKKETDKMEIIVNRIEERNITEEEKSREELQKSKTNKRKRKLENINEEIFNKNLYDIANKNDETIIYPNIENSFNS